MKTYFDCIPCFINQTLKAVRLLNCDDGVQKDVLRQVMRLGSELDFSTSPPAMGQAIHRVIREMTGSPDPFKTIKEQSNQLALRHVPQLKKRITESSDPFETAVRVAIAGNIIDFAKLDTLDEEIIERAITDSFTAELSSKKVNEFRQAINDARGILYLGDNAGEIVFDRLLIEQLPMDRVTFAVRGHPTINDATLDDAVAAGLTELVTVIDNGSDIPGTLLNACSAAFQEQFQRADLIIAKGQGNYETLNDVDHNIYFLLKVKCTVVATDTQSVLGSFVLQKTPFNTSASGVA